MVDIKIPSFESETEERAWWDAHEDEVQQDFADAVHSGHAASLAEALQSYRGTHPDAVLLDPEDAVRAQRQAASKGMRYQAYLKMVLHEALLSQEKKA